MVKIDSAYRYRSSLGTSAIFKREKGSRVLKVWEAAICSVCWAVEVLRPLCEHLIPGTGSSLLHKAAQRVAGGDDDGRHRGASWRGGSAHGGEHSACALADLMAQRDGWGAKARGPGL